MVLVGVVTCAWGRAVEVRRRGEEVGRKSNFLPSQVHVPWDKYLAVAKQVPRLCSFSPSPSTASTGMGGPPVPSPSQGTMSLLSFCHHDVNPTRAYPSSERRVFISSYASLILMGHCCSYQGRLEFGRRRSKTQVVNCAFLLNYPYDGS